MGVTRCSHAVAQNNACAVAVIPRLHLVTARHTSQSHHTLGQGMTAILYSYNPQTKLLVNNPRTMEFKTYWINHKPVRGLQFRNRVRSGKTYTFFWNPNQLGTNEGLRKWKDGRWCDVPLEALPDTIRARLLAWGDLVTLPPGRSKGMGHC